MLAKFTFQSYQRPIQPPLQTHHGVWSTREGIVVQLCQDGRVGEGEIAPLPWFGSETLGDALAFCQSLPEQITEAQIYNIPDRLPACQFGLETAWQALTQPPPPEPDLPICGLLPTRTAALTAWPSLWQQGYRTFKWKIGVTEPQTELVQFKQLCQQLPVGAKLRLDANGGLDLALVHLWLTHCHPEQIEFLEQPLPSTEFTAMQALAQQSPIPLALDESVATLSQLVDCYQRGWPGIFVIKPAIIGSPRKLREFCQQHRLDLVFSSVLEGPIARQAGLRLAAELGAPGRAVGFGVSQWLGELTQTTGVEGIAEPIAQQVKSQDG